jgi:peptide/nickel transport system permease protein
VIGYLIRRLVQALVVTFLVTVIVFVLLRLLPGGPARAILGPRATALQIRTFNHQQGFDRAPPIQYLTWLGHVLRGDLGFSFRLNQSVAALIAERLPKTLILTVLSTLLTILVAVPLGVLQAVRRNSPVDHVFTGLAFVFYAAPPFFLALVSILVFSAWLPFLPAEAAQGGFFAILGQPSYLVLPVVTLALLQIALFSRYMRSSVLDNITQDYVRTAKAKGATERRILYGHVLRNSLIPIVTLMGLTLPGLFSGALISEQVFNYPGMGILFYQSAQQQDYPVLLGFTLIVAMTTVLGSLIADLAYAVLDPRVRYVRS